MQFVFTILLKHLHLPQPPIFTLQAIRINQKMSINIYKDTTNEKSNTNRIQQNQTKNLINL